MVNETQRLAQRSRPSPFIAIAHLSPLLVPIEYVWCGCENDNCIGKRIPFHLLMLFRIGFSGGGGWTIAWEIDTENQSEKFQI